MTEGKCGANELNAWTKVTDVKAGGAIGSP